MGTHYRKPITFGKGKGTIRPAEDEAEELIRCPACNHVFVVEEVILFDCDYTVKFKYFGDQGVTKKEDSVKGDDFHRLGKKRKWRNNLEILFTLKIRMQIKSMNEKMIKCILQIIIYDICIFIFFFLSCILCICLYSSPYIV